MGRKTARQLAVSCITVGLDDKCFFHMGMAGPKDQAKPQKWVRQAQASKMGRLKPHKMGRAGLMS